MTYLIELIVYFVVTIILLDQQDSVRTGKNHWFSGWKNSTEQWRFDFYQWYTGNNWKDRSWIVKNVFSFLLDGWHFHKFFIWLYTWLYIAHLNQIEWYWGLGIFGLHGGIMSLINRK